MDNGILYLRQSPFLFGLLSGGHIGAGFNEILTISVDTWS